MVEKLQKDLEQCNREIADRTEPHPSLIPKDTWLNGLGEIDWRAEKAIIERELKDAVG